MAVGGGTLEKIPKSQKSLSFYSSCLLLLPGQNWLILEKQKEAPSRLALGGWLPLWEPRVQKVGRDNGRVH